MNFVESTILAFILGIIAFVGIVHFSGDDYNKELESSYGVKIVTFEGHLLSENRVIIEKDGQEFRCDVPSRDEMKNKTPMTCDETLKITTQN